MQIEHFDSTTHYSNALDSNALNHIPGDYGLPFIGKAIPMVSNLHATVDEHYKKYGEISRLRMGGQEGLLVVGADNYQTIFEDKQQNFSHQMGYRQSLFSLFPSAILLHDFDEHQALRKMLLPLFSQAQLALYLQQSQVIFQQHILSLKDKSAIVCLPFIQGALLDVLLKIFIGIDPSHAQASIIKESFIQCLEGLFSISRKEIPDQRFALGHEAHYALHHALLNLSEQAAEGALGLLIQQKEQHGFSATQIIEQLIFLLFAAYDTSASLLSNLMMHTGRYTLWQNKMREEAKAIAIEGLHLNTLSAHKSLHLCIQETLRLHPAMPMLVRRSINPCQLGGYEIPAHTIIWLAPTYNHRLETFWHAPHHFDPLRFAAERAEHKKHPYCFVPFGGGTHQCIGQHLASLLVTAFMQPMLLHFEYFVHDHYQPQMDYFPMPKPQDDLPLRLKPVI